METTVKLENKKELQSHHKAVLWENGSVLSYKESPADVMCLDFWFGFSLFI